MKGLNRTSCFWGLFLCCGSASAELVTSYDITVPPEGYFFAAYHFEEASIEEVFPSVPDGTLLLFWDFGAQQYEDPVTYIQGFGWHDGTDWVDDRPIAPATGFFVGNPLTTDLTLTITGSVLSATSYQVELTAAKFNALGFAYPEDEGDLMLDCVAGGRYVQEHMDYTAATGDEVLWWDPTGQAWVVNERLDVEEPPGGVYWSEEGTDVSITLPIGWGFMVKPVDSKQWDHPKTVPICGQ